MGAFIGALYVGDTLPRRRRQERELRGAIGLDRRGWPLPELEEEEDVESRPPAGDGPKGADGKKRRP